MSENSSDSIENKSVPEGIETETSEAKPTSATNDASSSNVADADVSIQPSLSEVNVEEEPGSQTLEEALEKFGIELPPSKVSLLKEYCEILWTWNERLNLTRHTTYDKFVSRDLVDAIHLAAQLQPKEHVLDVGSGGGAPGLIVAILRPDVEIDLCDATGKKADALGHIVDELGLNINVWLAKAEDLLRKRRYHTLTIRAVGKMRSLLTMFAPVWFAFNRILMIKGPKWLAERGEARHYNMLNSIALRKVDEYENLEDEHSSVILQLCRKNRIEEMERRAKERAEGLPYDGTIEEIVVDNRPREAVDDNARREFHKGAPHERGRSGKFGERNRSSKRPNFSSEGSQSEENSERSEKRSGFQRRNNKPPKGWTGKKSEFKEEQDMPEGANRPNPYGRKSSRPHGKGHFGNSRPSHGYQNKRSPRQNRGDSNAN